MKPMKVYTKYNAYRHLYGRGPAIKALQATHSANVLAGIAHAFGVPVVVSEIAAGQNEHRLYFMEAAGYPILSYTGYDIFSENKDVRILDCVAGPMPKAHLAVSYYYTLGSICLTESSLLAHLKTVYNSLEKGGAYHSHFQECGYNSSLDSVQSDELDIPIAPYDSIRKELGFSAVEPLTLVGKREVTYDRVSAILTHKTKNLSVKGKKLVCSPLYTRNWSEPELVYFGKLAGFSSFSFYSSVVENTDVMHSELPNTLDPAQGLDSSDGWANSILFRK